MDPEEVGFFHVRSEGCRSHHHWRLARKSGLSGQTYLLTNASEVSVCFLPVGNGGATDGCRERGRGAFARNSGISEGC